MSESYVAKSRKWLEPYLRDLSKHMNLAHWTITLEDESPGELSDSRAGVWLADDYNRAKLYVNVPESMNDLRQSLVHELVHLHMRDWMRSAEALEGQLRPSAWEIAHTRIDHEMEQAVDAIAMAWAESLPLPVMHKRKKST